jgi:hypothetical protein
MHLVALYLRTGKLPKWCSELKWKGLHLFSHFLLDSAENILYIISYQNSGLACPISVAIPTCLAASLVHTFILLTSFTLFYFWPLVQCCGMPVDNLFFTSMKITKIKLHLMHAGLILLFIFHLRPSFLYNVHVHVSHK